MADYKVAGTLRAKKDELCGPSCVPTNQLTFQSRPNIRYDSESSFDDIVGVDMPPIPCVVQFLSRQRGHGSMLEPSGEFKGCVL